MSVKQSDYEGLLAEYSSPLGAISLLKQYRPYLEILPSIRRLEQSLITIPLPVVRICSYRSDSNQFSSSSAARIATQVPCDLGILICDPEWQIKLGIEILVFIHRPEEDFSQLLGRWRQTQIYLDRDYEWLMPLTQANMFSEAAEKIYPLFVVFEQTPERIQKGISGAGLPFIIQTNQAAMNREITEIFSTSD